MSLVLVILSRPQEQATQKKLGCCPSPCAPYLSLEGSGSVVFQALVSASCIPQAASFLPSCPVLDTEKEWTSIRVQHHVLYKTLNSTSVIPRHTIKNTCQDHPPVFQVGCLPPLLCHRPLPDLSLDLGEKQHIHLQSCQTVHQRKRRKKENTYLVVLSILLMNCDLKKQQ